MFILKVILDPSYCPIQGLLNIARNREMEPNSFTRYWARRQSVHWSFSCFFMYDFLFIFTLPRTIGQSYALACEQHYFPCTLALYSPLTANLPCLPTHTHRDIIVFLYQSIGSNIVYWKGKTVFHLSHEVIVCRAS